jgi:hypothetical protein
MKRLNHLKYAVQQSLVIGGQSILPYHGYVKTHLRKLSVIANRHENNGQSASQLNYQSVLQFNEQRIFFAIESITTIYDAILWFSSCL